MCIFMSCRMQLFIQKARKRKESTDNVVKTLKFPTWNKSNNKKEVEEEEKDSVKEKEVKQTS